MIKLGKPKSSKGLATFCAKIADDKLARDIVIIKLSDVENAPAEYFVICTCDSTVQVDSVIDSIESHSVNVKMKRPRVEGFQTKEWVILDFFDVVVHIMLKDTREYYKLEKLWGDCSFYELSDSGTLRTLKNSEYLNKLKDYAAL